MNILISNDDGINSAGIKSLAKAFSRLGNVYVVAPEGERSSNSHHLTCVGKVKIEKRDLENAAEAYALWGTPADCVYLGLDFLFKDRIDLVVSGINIGLNVSTDIVYSGTIAAAREAYIHRIPSVAVSIDYGKDVDFDTAGEYALMIAQKYLQDEKRNDYFLNINVPNLKMAEVKGIRVCKNMAVLHYDNNVFWLLLMLQRTDSSLDDAWSFWLSSSFAHCHHLKMDVSHCWTLACLHVQCVEDKLTKLVSHFTNKWNLAWIFEVALSRKHILIEVLLSKMRVKWMCISHDFTHDDSCSEDVRCFKWSFISQMFWRTVANSSNITLLSMPRCFLVREN